MLNQPGVQTFFSGSEKRARRYLPKAFALLAEYRRANANRVIEIDRFERRFGDVRIEIKVHHNQASLFIHASAADQPEIVQPLPQRRVRFKRRDELERYDLIRLYVHVDVITKTQFYTMVGDEISRADVSSAVAAAVYDTRTKLFSDLRVITVPYLIAFDYYISGEGWDGEDWSGVLSDVTVSLDETIAYYESILPSHYGVGTVSPSLETLPTWIENPICMDPIYVHPFEENWMYPWSLDPAYKAAADSVKDTQAQGCCTGFGDYIHHEHSSGTDHEYWRSDNYKKIDMNAATHTCDKVHGEMQHEVHPSTWREFAHAFRSGIYGMVFNGWTQRKPYGNFDGAFIASGAARSAYVVNSRNIFANAGPIINDAYFGSDVLMDFGFQSSWQLPDGLRFHGEAFHLNAITCAADFSANGASAYGLINVSASLGVNLEPLTLVGAPETVATTAKFVELIKAAIVEAGGVLIHPTLINDKVADSQLTYPDHGIAAVDIRSLPGSFGCSPIFNLKCYAAPIVFEERRTATTIEEY